MANPQKENGYTPIANEILEALAGIRIPGEARQCLDVIIRKTYGFRKREDKISLSQFCLLAKIRKGDVCRALLKLAEINLIISKKANDNTTTYRLNKDFDTWKPLAKKRRGVAKKQTTVSKKAYASLAKKRHTIETTTKETITKETVQGHSDSGIQKILNIFYEINPGLNFGNKTERECAKWLIDKYGLDKATKTATYAISIQGQRYAPTITTPYQLKNKLGELTIFFRKEKSNQPKII